MKKIQFLSEVQWNDERPAIQVLLETSASKEIRIAMQKNQTMKEHKAPFPITVQVIKGKIDFGVEGTNFELVTGDLIGLEANIPHDLKAIEESIVRLSLSKLDSVQRVQKV